MRQFVEGRGDAAEAAFRLLLERHGPMVQRACRGVIGDGHAAQDAAQAVFPVPARKAGPVRVRGTLAPRPHGVAVLASARNRLDPQEAFEEEGRITIGRIFEACQKPRDVETLPARTPAARTRAAADHLQRLEENLTREKAEKEVGRGTVADIGEAPLALELARVE